MKHFKENPSHYENPPKDCYGCRISGISFGSVPGGTRPGSFRASYERKFKNDMEAYREAKRAGEQPDAVSVEGVEKARKRKELMEKHSA